MNIPSSGVPINRRLLKIILALGICTFGGCYVLPRLMNFWNNRPSIKTVETKTFRGVEAAISAPPQTVHPTQATPAAKTYPAPCQACVQTAKEVLERYVKAVRDGAGTEDRLENNALSIPQQSPDISHPVFSPSMGDAQPLAQYQR